MCAAHMCCFPHTQPSCTSADLNSETSTFSGSFAGKDTTSRPPVSRERPAEGPGLRRILVRDADREGPKWIFHMQKRQSMLSMLYLLFFMLSMLHIFVFVGML